MCKRITITTERWCCDINKDLVLLDKDAAKGQPRHVIERMDRKCAHCGQVFKYHRFMDPAGSMDYSYEPVEPHHVADAAVEAVSDAHGTPMLREARNEREMSGD